MQYELKNDRQEDENGHAEYDLMLERWQHVDHKLANLRFKQGMRARQAPITKRCESYTFETSSQTLLHK